MVDIVLTTTEIQEFLRAHTNGHLGCIEANTPFVYPMVYAYKDGMLYGQTSIGNKVNILRQNPRCCFQVQETMPASWRSVMVWGEFQELDISNLQQAEQTMIAQLLSLSVSELQEQFGVHLEFNWDSKAAQSNTLWRIKIQKYSGIQKAW